jgi:hypothetical protein
MDFIRLIQLKTNYNLKKEKKKKTTKIGGFSLNITQILINQTTKNIIPGF